MKKLLLLNIGTITAILITFGLACYCLLMHELFSISAIIRLSADFNLVAHILILTLIPIYVAMVIFGAVVLSFYLKAFCKEVFAYLRNDCRVD